MVPPVVMGRPQGHGHLLDPYPHGSRMSSHCWTPRLGTGRSRGRPHVRLGLGRCLPLPVVGLCEPGQSQSGVQGWGRQLDLPGHPEGQRPGGGAQREGVQAPAPEIWWPGTALSAGAGASRRDPQRWTWGGLGIYGPPCTWAPTAHPELGVMSADLACPSLKARFFFKNSVSGLPWLSSG